MATYRFTNKNNTNVIESLQQETYIKPNDIIKRSTKTSILPTSPQYGSLGNPFIINIGSGYSYSTQLLFDSPTLASGSLAQASPIFGTNTSCFNLISPGENHQVGDQFFVSCSHSENIPAIIEISSVDTNGGITDFYIKNNGYKFNNNDITINFISKESSDAFDLHEPSTRQGLDVGIFEFVPDTFSIVDISMTTGGSGYQTHDSNFEKINTYKIATDSETGLGFAALVTVGPIVNLEIESAQINSYEKLYRDLPPTNFQDRRLIKNTKSLSIETIDPIITKSTNNTVLNTTYKYDSVNQLWSSILTEGGSSSSEACIDPTTENNPVLLGTIDPTLLVASSITTKKHKFVTDLSRAVQEYRIIAAHYLELRQHFVSRIKEIIRQSANSPIPIDIESVIQNFSEQLRQNLIDSINQLFLDGRLDNAARFDIDDILIQRIIRGIELRDRRGFLDPIKDEELIAKIADALNISKEQLKDLVKNNAKIEVEINIRDNKKSPPKKKGPEPTKYCPKAKKAKQTRNSLAITIAALAAAGAAGWSFFINGARGSEIINDTFNNALDVLDYLPLEYIPPDASEIAFGNEQMGDGTFESLTREAEAIVRDYILGQISEEDFRYYFNNQRAGILSLVISKIIDGDSTDIDDVIDGLNDISSQLDQIIEDKKIDILLTRYQRQLCVELFVDAPVSPELCEDFCRNIDNSDDNGSVNVPVATEIPVSQIEEFLKNLEFRRDNKIPKSPSRCY